MGKGNRNRVGREDSELLVRKPAKAKKHRPHRPLPKLLVPIVALVVVVAIVVTAVAVSLVNGGTFKRNNVLVKSQTSGKYSINQQTAMVLIWKSMWDQAASYYSQYNSYLGLADTQFEYCWSQAKYAYYNISTYIGNYFADSFASIVASCDEGVRTGVEFTKEEQNEAYNTLIAALKEEGYSFYSYYYGSGSTPSIYVRYNNYPYFGQFLKEALGKDIKESDLRRAAIIQAYANKVDLLKQEQFWNTTDENVAAEVKNNPDSYYTTDYLTYSTSDAALVAILKNTTTEGAFKSAIVTASVKKDHVSLYNRYVTEKAADVNSALDAVRSKTTAEELDAALAEQGMIAAAYPKAENGLRKEQTEWLFDEERAPFDATSVTSEDGLTASVLVVKEIDSETGNVTAAIKEFAYDQLTGADLDKLTNTVLKRLDLPVADGADVWESADEKADALTELLNAEGADKAAIMTSASAVEAAAIVKESGTVAEKIREAVFADGVVAGAVLKVSDTDSVHVVLVKTLTAAVEANEEAGTAETPASADIAYVTFAEEKIEQVIDSLVSSLESDLPDVETAYYRFPADVKLEKVKAELNAAASKENYLSRQYATTVPGLTAENRAEQTSLPDAVADAVLAEGVAAGAVLTAEVADSTSNYLIYVTSVTDGVSFSYLTVATYEEGSYLEWLFKDVDTETMTGGAASGTTFVKEPEGTSATQSVYLAVGETLKLDTEAVVRGGYIQYTGENAKTNAEADLESLKDLKDSELLNALSDLNSGATVSELLRESAVDGALKDWLFADTRVANDASVVTVTEDDGTETVYLAVFLKNLAAYQSTARSNYASDSTYQWLDALVADGGYAVSEKALAKVKNPKMRKSEEEISEETSEEETTESVPTEDAEAES